MSAHALPLVSARATESTRPNSTGGMSATMRSAGTLLAVGALFSGAAYWGWDTGRLPVPPIFRPGRLRRQ